MTLLVPVCDHLFDFVVAIDPRRKQWEELSQKALAKCRSLKAEVDEVLRTLPSDAMSAKLKESLASASKYLDELSDALQNSGAHKWRSLYGSLARCYEQLTRSVRAMPGYEGSAFKTLRQRNLLRNVFHISSGIGAALTYHFFLERHEAAIIMLVFASLCTVLEVLRHRSSQANDLLMRFPLFSQIARPHEYNRVNSSTYYAFGLLIATAFFPKIAAEVACVVLAVGDPVASNVGRAFGRHPIVNGRSVEGSLGFVIAAWLAVSIFLIALHPELGLATIALVSTAAALGGALIELYCTKLDDNLAVPAGVALSVAFLVI